MWINKNTVSLHYPLGMGTGNHSLRSRTRRLQVQGLKALSTRTEGFKYKEQEGFKYWNKKALRTGTRKLQVQGTRRKKTVDFYDKQEQD